MDFLTQLREKLSHLIDERKAAKAELDSILEAPAAEARDLNDDEAARFAAAKTKVTDLDGSIAAAEARVAELAELEAAERRQAAIAPKPAATAVGGAVVRNEERTYDAHKRETSFFADAYNATQGNRGASERIERHMREVEVERRDITTTTLNGLVPPLYLLDQAATLARAMRPFADVVPGYALPSQGVTLTVTRVTTGTATAVQTSQNTAATETDIITTDFTVPVVTIMGQQDVSRQALDRASVTDQLIFNDLLADYATRLDAGLISGSGSNGQALGILNVSSIDTQTFTGTTVASFISRLNGALSAVTSNRFAPASVIVMHPRRWHWLLAGADTTNRPLVVPYAGSAQNPQGIGMTNYGPAGSLAGLPVIVDANVPTNLGASTNEDRVVVTRLSDHALWEDPSGVMTFRFDQSVNAPATIRLAVAGYSAFTAGRYPSATSVVVGTGLTAPTF